MEAIANIKDYVLDTARRARRAALKLSRIDTATKNNALRFMIQLLQNRADEIKEKNQIDLQNGKKAGLSSAMLDRLELNDKRIAGMIEALETLIELEDPSGRVDREWKRPNGMTIKKLRVPIGVIGIIYESRPNVTVDAASLCLKTGNATILRGGKEALHSNKVLTDLFREALMQAGIPQDAIQLIETIDREAVSVLLKQHETIDLIIPRGGEGLIRHVVENSTIPVIKHYKGVCHLYADKELDENMAERVIINAKVQRPGVCNALETLLVHQDLKDTFLPRICSALHSHGVEIHGDAITCKKDPQALLATEEDWYAEYLDLILAVRVVKNLDEALDHIETYGSRHSDGILTTNPQTADTFLMAVDSAAVFHNVSTRFTDGGQFGMGAEIGVSTDKLHARGPMGLEELTSYKYVVTGSGQIRE
ncbi:MAG: glutamate-5-semialdehyde dehydrogenase [Candidatus Auribacter fodinae]|jgi:glutamate-5-semialdehyde dehydrogenase|uniref:Gamma-glutamyl phosphate reductase n=1 Tax=Candidatus Auribacter fodinae TaxID=2093366 RepID=A0A3A4R553_9BACT|nr:MAG: glutamate-5-semialdehyde dehydrogenase [Candidatus Auribacter fodinae]